MDCWSWSELLELELGNIPFAKRTGPMPTFWNQVIVNWAFIWCKSWDVFEFICYIVLVQIVILILCLMLYSELIKEYFIWYMRRQRRLLAMEFLTWMWSSLFDVLIFMMSDISNCLLIIAWFKVQRENGFSIWHSCLLDCIPLVRSFQLLTFKFVLRIASSSPPTS